MQDKLLSIKIISDVHSTRLQGPVVRSLVSANRCLRGIKAYRFPWYLTLVSANHASSNPGQGCHLGCRSHKILKQSLTGISLITKDLGN